MKLIRRTALTECSLLKLVIFFFKICLNNLCFLAGENWCTLINTQKQSYKKAQMHCNKVGGELFSPQNTYELRSVTKYLKHKKVGPIFLASPTSILKVFL